MNRIIIVAAACLSLGACGSPATISSNPTATVLANATASPLGGKIAQGLLDAEWNLDQAVSIGALPANDPADACLHTTLTQLGLEPTAAGATPATPPASFVPRSSDLVFAPASIAYIVAQQLKGVPKSITIAPGCYAIIGKMVVDFGQVTGKALLPSVVTVALPTLQ